MARIRSIKPEFFTSTQLAEVTPNARLLFIGMWVFADDRGVHPADYVRLKMEVFPADDVMKAEVIAWIGELIEQGLVAEFEVDGKRFWNVTGWHHQKIEKPTYKYPAPPPAKKVVEPSSMSRREVADKSASSRRVVGEASVTERRGEDLDGERIGRGEDTAPSIPLVGEGGGEALLDQVDSSQEESQALEEKSQSESTTDMSEQPTVAMQEVVAAWNSLPKEIPKVAAMSAGRRSSLKARLGEKFFRENWRRGIDLIARSDFCRGHGNRGWRAKFDWFLTPDVLPRIIEGHYENNSREGPSVTLEGSGLANHGKNIKRGNLAEALRKISASGSQEGGQGSGVPADAGGDSDTG